MTTAVWIAEASVGQVRRQVQKSDDLAEASGAVVGATPTKLASLFLIRRERFSREDGVAFYIGAASVMARVFQCFLPHKGNWNGLSRAFGIRHQDGRCRRIQNLHVDTRHHHPRLYGRRHPGAGGVVCGDDQRQHRPADRRRAAVPGRLLHALSARLRSVDRRVRAVAAGAARQAPGRHARRRLAQLGPGVHRQLCRRASRWRS